MLFGQPGKKNLELMRWTLKIFGIWASILLGSARFCSVLLGSARFCSVLLGSPRFCSVLLGSLLGSARFCSVLLGSARFSARFCSVLPRFSSVLLGSPRFSRSVHLLILHFWLFFYFAPPVPAWLAQSKAEPPKPNGNSPSGPPPGSLPVPASAF